MANLETSMSVVDVLSFWTHGLARNICCNELGQITPMSGYARGCVYVIN